MNEIHAAVLSRPGSRTNDDVTLIGRIELAKVTLDPV
jgi:hypothetical protein